MSEENLSVDQLLQEFEESRYSKPFQGTESKRNTFGRLWHGFGYKHPFLSKTLGIGLILSSAVGAITVPAFAPLITSHTVLFSTAVFGSVILPTLTAGTLLSAPGQKKASQFLMNVAVKKANMLNKFMQKEKGIDATLRQEAIKKCLLKNMPIFCAKQYDRDFPNAAEQIANLPENGDLPLYRNKNVFKLEVAENIFNKWRSKGGILKTISNAAKRTEHHVAGFAEKISKQMEKDYNNWKEDTNPNKPSWSQCERIYLKAVPTEDEKMPKNWAPYQIYPSNTAPQKTSIFDSVKKLVRYKSNLVCSIKKALVSPSKSSFVAPKQARRISSDKISDRILQDAITER